MCEHGRCLIFCACNVIVSIFVSCLYFHLILLCVYVFATIERSFVAHLHALVDLFVVCWYVAFERGTISDVLYAKVLHGVSFRLFHRCGCPVPVLHNPQCFMVFVFSEMSHGVISWFCLAPCLFGASFALNPSYLCFRDFFLAPILLGVSFLSKCFCLRFCNFDWAPSLSGASFLSERFHLCFHDFDWAPSLLGALFLSEHFHLCFRDFGWAPSLSGASCDVPPLSKDGQS
jgi:hypothetical protein